MNSKKWVCLLLAALLCAAGSVTLGACGSSEQAEGYRQLTKKELALDTRALAELVLKSSYVSDITADMPEDEEGSFAWACDSFNGLEELTKREDAGDVLAQIYNEAVSILSQRLDGDAIDAGIYSSTLLSYPVFDEKRTVALTEFSWASIIMYHITDETSS